MPRDFDRPTQYRAEINLYVEDPITLTYLKELWSDRAFAYFIGGGHEAVGLIVRVDQQAGHPNVFGVTDRDYGQSNLDKVTNPGTRVFRLSAHEVENHLLDAPALASSRWNNLGRSVEEIEDFLIQAAEKRCWYEACRTVLGTIRRRFHEDFITDPPENLADLEAARQHLCESPWFIRLASHTAQTTEPDVVDLLKASHAQGAAWIGDGTWRQVFAGKEIFKDVASRICDRQKLGGFRSSQLYEDLAQAVAAWQRENGRVPPELTLLRSALRQRVGLV